MALKGEGSVKPQAERSKVGIDTKDYIATGRIIGTSYATLTISFNLITPNEDGRVG